jgi:hypothetical protein
MAAKKRHDSLKSKVKPESESELEVRPISDEARRQALAGIPELRALREAILAERGGELIDVAAALREARAAHERGE